MTIKLFKNGDSGTMKESIAEQAKSEGIKAIGAVAFYMVTSISVVLLNKYILVSFSFVDGPIFMTWYQLLITLLITLVIGWLGKWIPLFSFMPEFSFSFEKAKSVLPASFFYSMMILSNNICLNFVDVSFFQIVRSLTIVFNIIFSFVILNVRTSKDAMKASGIVFVGYIVGCLGGYVEISLLGIVFGVAASCFVSLNSIFVKKVLPVLNDNQWRLMQYNTPIAMCILLPFLLFSGEISGVVGVLSSDRVSEYWMIMTVTGIFGFLINLSTLVCVKFTSPLTYSISSNSKSAVQTFLGMLLFREPVTLQSVVGNVLTIGGSLFYSWVRYLEMGKNIAIKKMGGKDEGKILVDLSGQGKRSVE